MFAPAARQAGSGNKPARALAAGAALQRYRPRRAVVAGSLCSLPADHGSGVGVPGALCVEACVLTAMRVKSDRVSRWRTIRLGNQLLRAGGIRPGQDDVVPDNSRMTRAYLSAGRVLAPPHVSRRRLERHASRALAATRVLEWGLRLLSLVEPLEHDRLYRNRSVRGGVATTALGVSSRDLATNRRRPRVDHDPTPAVGPRRDLRVDLRATRGWTSACGESRERRSWRGGQSGAKGVARLDRSAELGGERQVAVCPGVGVLAVPVLRFMRSFSAAATTGLPSTSPSRMAMITTRTQVV